MDNPQEKYLLIVDDMRFICQLLAEALTVEGLAVKTSLSGEQAISIIRSQAPALIIIDQVMPGKDGLQTLREAQELISGVPVIMISGYEEEQQAVIEVRKLGLIQHYVTKPFDMPYLIQLVEEMISSPPRSARQKIADL